MLPINAFLNTRRRRLFALNLTLLSGLTTMLLLTFAALWVYTHVLVRGK